MDTDQLYAKWNHIHKIKCGSHCQKNKKQVTDKQVTVKQKTNNCWIRGLKETHSNPYLDLCKQSNRPISINMNGETGNSLFRTTNQVTVLCTVCVYWFCASRPIPAYWVWIYHSSLYIFLTAIAIIVWMQISQREEISLPVRILEPWQWGKMLLTHVMLG